MAGRGDSCAVLGESWWPPAGRSVVYRVSIFIFIFNSLLLFLYLFLFDIDVYL